MLFRTSSKPRSLFKTGLSLIGWCGSLGAIGVCAMGLSAFFAPELWFADNMSFFLKQYLAAGLAGVLGGTLGFVIRHRLLIIYRTLWVIALVSLLALAGLTGARTLANTAPTGPLAAGRQPLKIVSINIEHLFLGDKVLQAFLEKEDADIIVIEETLWWLQERRWRRLGLPVGSAGENGFPDYLKVGELGGLAIYSRYPVTKTDRHIIKGELPPGANVYYDADRELMSLTLDTDAGPLNLLAIHPDSPRTEPRWQNKRRYMDEVDKVIDGLRSENAVNILAIGDWNSSPWSSRFQKTLSRNKLKTAYSAPLPPNTRFFFDYRLHWILGAPVDQFAASQDIQIVDVSLGPDIGSDHLPLIVKLGLNAPEADTDTGTDTDANASTGTDNGTGTAPVSTPDTAPDVETDSSEDAGSEAGENTGSDTGSDANSGTSSRTGADTDATSGSGAGSE